MADPQLIPADWIKLERSSSDPEDARPDSIEPLRSTDPSMTVTITLTADEPVELGKFDPTSATNVMGVTYEIIPEKGAEPVTVTEVGDVMEAVRL